MVNHYIPIPVLTQRQLRNFLAKVDKQSPDICWNWLASSIPTGYGQVRLRPLGMFYAHRVVYFIEYGEDPGSKFVCHTCDNPACCNPAHLWLGTQRENLADMVVKGRGPSGVKNPMSILTEQDVVEILRSEDTQKNLAIKYNVCPDCIKHIKSGKTWKHVRQRTSCYQRST